MARSAPSLTLIAFLLLVSASPKSLGQQKSAGPVDAEPEDLRAGLPAIYTSLAKRDATLARVDNQPALAWGHASPHPRLPPGPLEVSWSGLMLVKDGGPLQFEAFVGGEVTMQVDGVTVLQGRGASERTRIVGERLERPVGLYRVRIDYRTQADVPARLQIRWQGPGFALEPIPPWHFKHLAAEVPAPVKLEETRSLGRNTAGQLGCARCHQQTFPGVTEPPPGPALADLGLRIDRDWLVRWLADPNKVLHGARMPALFGSDRAGHAERWLVAEYLLGPAPAKKEAPPAGDHREGRKIFFGMGCVACHQSPEKPEHADRERTPLRGLTQRLPAEHLTAFLANPHGRYPDGRMPHLPLTPVNARDLAAYLLMWSGSAPDAEAAPAPTKEEIQAALDRLKVRDSRAAGAALMQQKNCAACHPGLGATLPRDIPVTKVQGCLTGKTLPRFELEPSTRDDLVAFLKVARLEKHPAPVAARQRLLERSGCVRCHARDTERPSPLERIGTSSGGAFLQAVPFQRTPRLTHAHQKFAHGHLLAAVREGVSGLRPEHYTYRMPAFGNHAESLVQALAEADGDLPGDEPAATKPADPTLVNLTGPNLVGFQGYACVACHIWNGQSLSSPDPGAVGTDLTRVAGRIRRDWFERFLENPGRIHPSTPMPNVFQRGKPATLTTFLEGDAGKQRDVLWHYFAQGKLAASPKPPPPLAVTAPMPTMSPLVAQIPLRTPDNKVVESIAVLWGTSELGIFDLATGSLNNLFVGGQILRHVQGRVRTFQASGTPAMTWPTGPAWRATVDGKLELPLQYILEGYDPHLDGVHIRHKLQFASGTIEISDLLRVMRTREHNLFLREIRVRKLRPGTTLQLSLPKGDELFVRTQASVGEVKTGQSSSVLTPDKDGHVAAVFSWPIPHPRPAPLTTRTGLADPGKNEGSLVRPGYRALEYPRPKTPWGEDLLMPSAVAVHPRDGRVFVASMKQGEIFVLRDPSDDGRKAHFENYGRGLFQEAYSLLAEEDALYVLHRRNLTKITETEGVADRFERVAQLPHGIADSYDYAYGLVRERSGAFVATFAPHANRHLPGSGSAVRLRPGKPPEEIAYGFRNPLGWCAGPAGDVFFTDNQGEWVASNKLCHLQEGRFFGYPNPQQKQHASKPLAATAVWVPYGWARSINAVTYDHTGGKFGPFAGQFFLAELMQGGAIVRAQVEKVNGVYQGACFPFWGKGLLGPLTLAFDPRGRLFVGSVTEPGWMAQPDRGALYRIDFTGQTPFEMQTIHVRPRGFRIAFTAPVDAAKAQEIANYAVEHFRYEFTGSYGSPEMDRTRVGIEKVKLAEDRLSVEVTTGPLVAGRVYMISAAGVRSAKGEALVNPTGAYTLNEIPR